MISENNHQIHIYHNHEFLKTHIVETWFQMIANWIRNMENKEGYETLMLPENNQFFPIIDCAVPVFMLEKQIANEAELELFEADAIFNVSYMSSEKLKSKNRFRYIGKFKISKKEERINDY